MPAVRALTGSPASLVLVQLALPARMLVSAITHDEAASNLMMVIARLPTEHTPAAFATIALNTEASLVHWQRRYVQIPLEVGGRGRRDTCKHGVEAWPAFESETCHTQYHNPPSRCKPPPLAMQ